ncbi:MAG: tetratricopeptide repeat protein [Syntrophomonadaceae bacterium]
MELEEYSDEELLERAREAAKREQWTRGRELLGEYVRRCGARHENVPASAMASYALALTQTGDRRLGIDLCRKAVAADPRNAHIFWCLAQIHLLAGSRKEAIEAVERGLRAAPDNFVLLRMRRRLGVRQPTPLPFLDRRHGLNVRLGRIIHKLKGSAAVLIPI